MNTPRINLIRSAHPVCPACHSRQVQLKDESAVPPKWKCRECKVVYGWEPPPGPQSPHSPSSAPRAAQGGVGIAGAMQHAQPAPNRCVACGGACEGGIARAAPGRGVIQACSPECAASPAFKNTLIEDARLVAAVLLGISPNGNTQPPDQAEATLQQAMDAARRILREFA